VSDQSATTSVKEKAGGGLKDAAGGFGKSLFDFAVAKSSGVVGGLTDRLQKLTQGDDGESSTIRGSAAAEGAKAAAEGGSPIKGAIGGALSGVKDKIKDVFTGGGGGGGSTKALRKFSNIVEWVDVGVPVSVAYNQWTSYGDWPGFMRNVETADHDEEAGKIAYKGNVYMSHRKWEQTIIEMVPDSHIVWQSAGDKGYLNGAVSFHEVAPRLTRIALVIEYHPQGFFEHTYNIWRAVGHRVRRDLKLYVRKVMTSTILDPEAVEGWRGEIQDKEIVRTHEEVVEDERAQAEADEADAEEEGYDDQGEGYDDEAYSDEDGEYDAAEEPYEEEPYEEPRSDEADQGETDEYAEEPVEAEERR
jgi:uncharacterized membrane protein